MPVQVGDVGVCLGEIGWKGGLNGLSVGRCRLRRRSHDRAARDLELLKSTSEIQSAVGLRMNQTEYVAGEEMVVFIKLWPYLWTSAHPVLFTPERLSNIS